MTSRTQMRRGTKSKTTTSDAWIEFARRNPDGVNSSVSFYDKGELVSLLLDFEIRRRTENRASLDDVLRTMFELFPLNEGGYTNQDLRQVIEELTSTSFSDFFGDFVFVPLLIWVRLVTVRVLLGLEMDLQPNPAQ